VLARLEERAAAVRSDLGVEVMAGG
jgi:hypothetical protein